MPRDEVPTARPYRAHEAKRRRHFRERRGRLYSLPEMADLLHCTPRNLRERMRRNDGSAPPGFQPLGPYTPWLFAEASYVEWITEQEGKEA